MPVGSDSVVPDSVILSGKGLSPLKCESGFQVLCVVEAIELAAGKLGERLSGVCMQSTPSSEEGPVLPSNDATRRSSAPRKAQTVSLAS